MAWTNVGSLKGPKGDKGDKGTVTPATAIADLTEAPTAGDFNALLNALRAAGLMASSKPTGQGPLALFGDSQMILDSDTSITNMGPYPSGTNPGTATSWPSDQSKQIASITGLRVIDLYYGGARIARDETGYYGGWAMQSNRLASLVKADAANTPDVILIYGFYVNDLLDSFTDTKPATDLSKIAATYKAKFDELKTAYPNARIIYALQCMFQSDLTLSKSPITSGLPEGTDMSNAYKTLQSSERILFTSTSLGVEIMDCTDEVWALGKGLTVSDMVHPNADGAVKLGQILGRKLEQLLAKPPTESPNLYVAPSLPQTIKGITFSDAGNGGIHCKGTSSGYPILPSDTLTLQAGTYSVSPNEDVYMELTKGSITIIGESNPVKSIPAGDYTPKLVVRNGKTIDVTVYPRLVRTDQEAS